MASPEFKREQYLEKPLPSSPDSERVILGAILLDNALISHAIEQLHPDDFYSPLHRRIFRAMLNLFDRSERIDPILIGEELKKENQLESIGGVATITNFTYGLPHFSEIESYTKVVREKAMVRNLIKACNQITSEALAEEEEAAVVLDRAEAMIFALTDERSRQGFEHIQPVAETVLKKVQEYSKRESHALTGLATGFREFDQMTSGLQEADLIILAARPSMGKCLSFDSEIVTTDGSIRTIEEIYKNKSDEIFTLDNDYRFRETSIENFIDDGEKPVFKVQTKLGRKVETTISHPFLTINGWKKLSELKAGEKIAVPRKLNIFGEKSWRECDVKILAYLLGDGCLTKKSIEFTVANETLKDDFIKAVNEFGDVEAVKCNSENRTFTLRVRKTGGRSNKQNNLTSWLKSLKIWGCNSHRKFIPQEVFTLRKDLISLFLNRLFSTDGWASILKSGQVQIGFGSVSEKMIRQIQHLLLRFGVIAKLKRRSVKYKDTRRNAWQLDITDAVSIKTFLDEIGILGKEKVSKEILALLETKKYQTNRDLIPVEIWDYLLSVKGQESWTSLAKRAEIKGTSNIHAGKRSPTRERLGKFADALDDKYLKRISESEIYWDEIVSIEYAGEKQVYDLTIAETHNFVANDICVHNTALALTLAQNAATLEGAVVAVFSLEMSKEQLVMRMLSSEARVDAHRFRTGYLIQDEWGRLAQAIGTLSAAKIFIDDTAGISVMEMRAKCRRLFAEQKKIDLIVVDYLQLMSGSKRSESRQQEVSQISRELKGLAKELRVPVLALSQLSRAPEARNPPKPLMSDLRESGCLAGESLVTMADTGERIPIRELAGKKDFRVWALNENNWQIEKAVVTNAFSTGVKPVFRLKTKLGREIRATANHKFFSFNGWKRLDELKIGERIALPREIKNETEQTMSDAELALLAHLIGDGCTLPRHSIQYTTREKDLAETVANLASEVFGNDVKPKIKKERTWFQVYLTSTRHHTHNVRSAVAEWLDELGVWGLRSHEKFIPEKVFRQPKEAIALFLRHLWATDGCIRMKPGFYSPAVYYASSSKKLTRDVQSLLVNLSINAWLRRRSQNGKGRDQFHLSITGKPDLENFIFNIGAVGEYKNKSLAEIEEYLKNRVANTNRDVIPFQLWNRFLPATFENCKTYNKSIREHLGVSLNSVKSQNFSRERLLKLAGAIDSDNLENLAQSDIYWDQIMSIEDDEETEVFDLTVKDKHNFVCENIVLHNSIEQDADVVAFIYREEYYKPAEENAGVAEILISKQRNGPTGTVKLAFLKEFTRFENYFGD